MTKPKIDQLRDMVAAIGEEQIRYHHFFPAYADKLEKALGAYLGDPHCVALANASGPIDFDRGSCRHGGLGFDPDGKYRVPLMVRVKNLRDEGALDVRLILRCKLVQAINVIINVDGFEAAPSFAQDDIDGPCVLVFDCLKSLFDKGSWFDQRADYQTSGIGFLPFLPATSNR